MNQSVERYLWHVQPPADSLALWAGVEERLALVSRSSLLGCVCHLIVPTVRALVLNMFKRDHAQTDCYRTWITLLTDGPSPFFPMLTFSLRKELARVFLATFVHWGETMYSNKYTNRRL